MTRNLQKQAGSNEESVEDKRCNPPSDALRELKD